MYVKNKFVECPLEVETYYRDIKVKGSNSKKDTSKVYNNIYGILLPDENNYVFKIVDTTKNKVQLEQIQSYQGVQFQQVVFV